MRTTGILHPDLICRLIIIFISKCFQTRQKAGSINEAYFSPVSSDIIFGGLIQTSLHRASAAYDDLLGCFAGALQLLCDLDRCELLRQIRGDPFLRSLEFFLIGQFPIKLNHFEILIEAFSGSLTRICP